MVRESTGSSTGSLVALELKLTAFSQSLTTKLLHFSLSYSILCLFLALFQPDLLDSINPIIGVTALPQSPYSSVL